MARLLKITYASLAVGLNGNASITLTDKYKVTAGYTEFSITFECVVRNATRATFLTAEAALITSYSTPDAALEVQLGGTDRHDYDPASNTGFNARPALRKIGGVEDTANSARYECSVTIQLPANLSGRSGRQDSTVIIDSTPAGKRTLTVEGVYTALSGNSATAQYTAAGATYADAVALSYGTFNLVNPTGITYDDQNKVLRFRRIYEEVLYRESLVSVDVTALKRPTIQIDRSTPQNPSHSAYGTRPLEQIRVQYTTFVDKDTTTDLNAVWESTVRPLLVAEAARVGGGNAVVTRVTPAFNPSENSIQAAVEATVDLGGGFYACRVEDQDIIRNGVTLVPVWDGNPFARDIYDTPAAHRKILTRFTVARADVDVPDRFGIPDLPGFVEMEQYRTESPEHVGVTADGFDVLQITQTFVYDRADLDGEAPNQERPGRVPTFSGTRPS